MEITVLSRQFVSLLDMVHKLSGKEVAYAYGWLANAYGISTNEPITRPLSEGGPIIKEALPAIEEMCRKLDLPVTLDYFPIVTRALESAKTYVDIQSELGNLRERMHSELKAKLFLYVPSLEASHYNQREAFGSKVASKFKSSSDDIEHAGDCLALGMYTASVFHLMRVMERGVQKLGKKLGVNLTSEKNWQNILDEINKQIKGMPQKTAREKATMAKFAEAASHLYNVKLAWRNPVMHPKASYDSESAAEVYRSARSFMAHLAEII